MNTRLVDSCSDKTAELVKKLHERKTDQSREEPPTFRDGTGCYALSQVESNGVDLVLENFRDKGFWNWDAITDEPHEVWYTFKTLDDCGVSGWREADEITELIEEFKDEQTIPGEFNWAEINGHYPVLRLFVIARPESPRTQKAVEYFLDNPPEYNRRYHLPIGISAVAEYDYYRYREQIEELADELCELQLSSGAFAETDKMRVGYARKVTSFAIDALRKVGGYEENIEEAAEWLEDGLSMSVTSGDVYALHGLLQSRKGPMMPMAEHKWEQELSSQNLERVGAQFTQTFPPVESGTHKTEIRDTIEDIIQSTESTLCICSPYLDMLQEEIIDRSEETSLIDIKVITKPKGDISGSRSRLAKSAVEQLNRASNRAVRTQRLVHSRIILSDESLLLVSSADLTRDQLVDEFNAGLLTRNQESVKSAATYFENLWEASTPL